jgi:hypothetical protein
MGKNSALTGSCILSSIGNKPNDVLEQIIMNHSSHARNHCLYVEPNRWRIVNLVPCYDCMSASDAFSKDGIKKENLNVANAKDGVSHLFKYTEGLAVNFDCLPCAPLHLLHRTQELVLP